MFAELQAADEQAQECWNWNIGYAATEGGATGGLGFSGLAADVPALFTILLRLIQEIATCYGYKLTRDGEGEYVLQILRAGSAANAKVKIEFVIALKELEQILIQISWKKMSAELAAKHISKLSLLAAMRQFAKSLGIQITKRKALQLVPIVGAIVGASLNATLANDIGRAAYMSYRRRWMDERNPQ